MRLLELFSGTGSVSNALPDWETVSVDITDKLSTPTHKVNILEWDYRIYPPHHFDAIWASPPCTEYSILKRNTGMGQNLELADRIVNKTLEIIDYFQPGRWFIENPQTSMLKYRDMMLNKPFYDFDYCCFSDWGYRKRTRIWTNTAQIKELCKKEGACPNMTGRFHKVCFGGQGRPKEHIYQSCPAGATAYRVPERLVRRLFGVEVVP
jgi:hypothetical protein